MDKRLIKKLIESYVDEAFRTSSGALEEAENDELDLGDDSGADSGGLDDLGGGDGDVETGDDGGELDLGGEGGGLDGGAVGEDGEGEEGFEDDLGGDLGGGGGGGFGGGAGDFGGGDDFGGDETGEGDDAEDESSTPEVVDLPDDPVQAAVNIAINMLEETGDDNQILAAVKGSIQGNFENFRDAEPIITSLWATDHPILKVVARKLLLFIAGR